MGVDRLFPLVGYAVKDNLAQISRTAFTIEIPAPAASVLAAHHQLGAFIDVRGNSVQPLVLIVKFFSAEAHLDDVAAIIRTGFPVKFRERLLQFRRISDGRMPQMCIGGVSLHFFQRPALQCFKGGGFVLCRDSESLIELIHVIAHAFSSF